MVFAFAHQAVSEELLRTDGQPHEDGHDDRDEEEVRDVDRIAERVSTALF